MNLKNTALLLFIFSLVPGDTFYGDLGLTQSLFLIPLLLFYALGGKYLPANKVLRNAGFVFAFVLTMHLIVSLFSGLVEWYRTIGGLALVFIFVSLYYNNLSLRLQLAFLVLAGLIPILAFYLGYWNYWSNSFRMTFLKHDPNHLGHLIIYGLIALLAFINTAKKTWSILALPIFALYIVPLTFTFSRTSLIAGIVVFVFYLAYLSNRSGRIIFLAFLFGIVIYSSKIKDIDVIFQGIYRFSESNDTRVGFLEQGLKLASDNFLIGVGVDNFQNPEWRLKNGFSMSKYSENGVVYVVPTSTHNGFLDVFLIGGFFLFGAFITIITFPAIFLFRKTKLLGTNMELQWRKFLVYSFTITFILINITYSLYNSKLGWWGIAFSYVLIAPYYSTYLDKFKRKLPVYRRAEHASIAGI